MTFVIEKHYGWIGFDRLAMFSYQIDGPLRGRSGGFSFSLFDTRTLELRWQSLKEQPNFFSTIFGVGLSITKNIYGYSYAECFEYHIPIMGLVIGFLTGRPIKVRGVMKHLIRT